MKIEKQDLEIFKAVSWALNQGQDEALFDFLQTFKSFAKEPGINKYDIWSQIDYAIEQIENYQADPNDLKRINQFCKDI